MNKYLKTGLTFLSNFSLLFQKLFNSNLTIENSGIFLSSIFLKGSAKLILKSGYIRNSSLVITGQNNVLLFDENVKIINCKFIIDGNNCVFDFRGQRVIKNSKFELLDNNCSLKVGRNTGFNNNRLLVAGESCTIEIGSECIFAEGAEIWTSDTHSILDKNTSIRINQDKPVILKDRVWVGNKALILKGVTVGNDSIIAAGSIVTKSIDNNSLVGGLPAKIIRRDIKWDIKRL